MSWGSQARERLLPLPHRVLAVVRIDSLSLYEWQGRRRLGRQIAHWQAGDFTATIKHRHMAGQVEVWLKQQGQLRAILSAKSGALHHTGDNCATAIEQVAQIDGPDRARRAAE
jgi:hypothetical protein